MKKFICFLLPLIALTSCITHEYSKFESLDLEFEGVSMLKYRELGETMGYIGEIQAKGAKISIVGKGKYAKYTSVTIVEIDNSGEPQIVDEHTGYNAEWGEVKNNKDYTISLSINPNNSEKLREFMFYIGWGYEYSKVWIKQPPMKAE